MSKNVDYTTPYHWEMLRFLREKHAYPIRLLAPYLKKTDKVLDLGCGDGKLTSLLAGRVGEVRAADNQERALKFARILVAAGNVEFTRLDLCSPLPFRDGEFDLVTLFDVIEHLAPGMQAALLREIIRVLKPGGLFAVTTPNRLNLRTLLWGRFLRSEYHEREFSFRELGELAESAGFEPVAKTGIYLQLPVPHIEHYARVVPFVYFFLFMIRAGGYLPALSETIFAVFRKKCDDRN